MITTIALDLDNTLLNSDKKISANNEHILKQLHRAGKRVILCTGRPLPAIKHLIKQLELTEVNDYSITFNGGLVQNNNTQKIMAQTTLSRDNVNLLYHDAKLRRYPLDVLGADKVYSLIEFGKSEYEKFMNGMLPFENIQFSALPVGQGFGKVVCAAPAAVVNSTRAGLPADVLQNFHVVPSRPELLEFLPSGVNKAKGLTKLLSSFGESLDNLMAFGDEENDLEMIAGAGFGVAMGNAIPQIKEAAKAITLDNNTDGVAECLKKYFRL